METTTTASTSSPRKFSSSSVSFLVGILLFLLPFVEIRCNDQPFASNTGIGLAFGTDYKTTGQIKSLENPFGKNSSEEEKAATEKQKGKMYVPALIALILGAIGLILSLSNAKQNKASIFIGSLAAICLIVLMIQIQMDIKDTPKTGEDNFADNIKVTAAFTAWYYLSLISFIAAAFFSYNRKPIVITT
jgi:amino acid transporter